MFKKLEFYLLRKDFWSKGEKATESIYLVSELRQVKNQSYKTAKEIAEVLFSSIREGNDAVILYESLDSKIDGKPRLTLTKDGVVVEGLSSPSLLREIQKSLVEILSQGK